MFNKEKLLILAFTVRDAFNPKRSLKRVVATAWNLTFMYAAYETLLWFEWDKQAAVVGVVVAQMLWSAMLIEETANRDTLARDAEYWRQRADRAERILNVVLPQLEGLRDDLVNLKNQQKGGQL